MTNEQRQEIKNLIDSLPIEPQNGYVKIDLKELTLRMEELFTRLLAR